MKNGRKFKLTNVNRSEEAEKLNGKWEKFNKNGIKRIKGRSRCCGRIEKFCNIVLWLSINVSIRCNIAKNKFSERKP